MAQKKITREEQKWLYAAISYVLKEKPSAYLTDSQTATPKPVLNIPEWTEAMDSAKEEGDTNILIEEALRSDSSGNLLGWLYFLLNEELPPTVKKDQTAAMKHIAVALGITYDDLFIVANPHHLVDKQYADPENVADGLDAISEELDIVKEGELIAKNRPYEILCVNTPAVLPQPTPIIESGVTERDIPKSITKTAKPVAVKTTEDSAETKKWVKSRKGKIGSSDASNCIPGIGEDTVVETWTRLRTQKPVALNAAMEQGNGMQPYALTHALKHPALLPYNPVLKDDIGEVMFQSLESPALIATPDAVVEIDWDGKRTLAILEIKTTNRWYDRFTKRFAGHDTAVPYLPPSIVYQVHHQMMVMGLDVGFVVVYPQGSIPKSCVETFVHIFGPIPADADLHSHIRMCSVRMSELVKAGIHPLEDKEVFAKNWTADQLGKPETYGKVNLQDEDESVVADDKIYADWEQLKEIKASIKENKALEEELSNSLKNYIGHAQTLTDSNGRVLAAYSVQTEYDIDKWLAAIKRNKKQAETRIALDENGEVDLHATILRNPDKPLDKYAIGKIRNPSLRLK